MGGGLVVVGGGPVVRVVVGGGLVVGVVEGGGVLGGATVVVGGLVLEVVGGGLDIGQSVDELHTEFQVPSVQRIPYLEKNHKYPVRKSTFGDFHRNAVQGVPNPPIFEFDSR